MTQTQLARVAGSLYLVIAVCGGFSQLFVRSSVIVAGDALATVENIRASATLFGIGFVTDVVHIVGLIVLAFVLYALLSVVSKGIASTFVILNAIAVAILGANMINHAAALAVATDPTLATTLGAESADALALLFLDLHGAGYLIAQPFFGLWLLPLGYLVYRSGYVPRVLGVLLMVACVGYLAEVAAIYASPGFESSVAPYLALLGLAEIPFFGWLLVMGAKPERQDRRAPAMVDAPASA